MSGIPLAPFPPGSMGGVVAVTVFAFLSTVALVSIPLRVVWLGIAQHKRGIPSKEYAFLRTQLGHYTACLLLAHTITSSAGLINVQWLIYQGVAQDSACILQAIVMQVGNWATAYFTTSIAIHTFNTLVLRKRQSTLVCAITISVGWVLALLMAFIPLLHPLEGGLIYGADGLACNIQSVYATSQIGLHLLPIFLGLICSAVMFSIIFLVLRGTLVIRGGFKINLIPQDQWTVSGISVGYHSFIASIARSMLWYPAAYIALLVPYSTLRVLIISGHDVPFEAMVFAYTCWYLLGVVNALLFYNTFRLLGPAFDAMNNFSQRPKDAHSGADAEKFASVSDSFSEEAIGQPGALPYMSHRTSTREIPLSRPAVRVSQIEQSSIANVESFYSYPETPGVGRNKFGGGRSRSSPVTKNRASTSSSNHDWDHIRDSSIPSNPLPAPAQPNHRQAARSRDDGRDSPAVPAVQHAGTSERSSSSMSSRSTDILIQHPMSSAVNAAFGSASPNPAMPSPAPVYHRFSTVSAPLIGPVPAGRQRTVLGGQGRVARVRTPPHQS